MRLARRAVLAAGLAALPGCAMRLPPQGCALAPDGVTAWVVAASWHTEVALPAEALVGPLAEFAALLPGVRSVMFGFGKRSFVMAPERTLAEWLAAAVPGPAAMQVTGLRVTPDALRNRDSVALPITADQRMRLAQFVADSFDRDAAGRVRPAREEAIEGSLFFEARETYTVLSNCNTWTARALAATGLPVTAAGVLLREDVMAQVEGLRAACA